MSETTELKKGIKGWRGGVVILKWVTFPSEKLP